MTLSEAVLLREQSRSRRKREVRARSISVSRMTKAEIAAGRALYPDTDHWRPVTRADCVNGPRPCPYVSCRYHLFLDVSPDTGAIKINFEDLEVWELSESCSLDVADRGGTTLEDVGALMNVTRERVRQLEVMALAEVEVRAAAILQECANEGSRRRERKPGYVKTGRMRGGGGEMSPLLRTRLSEALDALGMSLSRAARTMGLSAGTLGAWLNSTGEQIRTSKTASAVQAWLVAHPIPVREAAE